MLMLLIAVHKCLAERGVNLHHTCTWEHTHCFPAATLTCDFDDAWTCHATKAAAQQRIKIMHTAHHAHVHAALFHFSGMAHSVELFAQGTSAATWAVARATTSVSSASEVRHQGAGRQSCQCQINSGLTLGTHTISKPPWSNQQVKHASGGMKTGAHM